jgi:hypothetical protein
LIACFCIAVGAFAALRAARRPLRDGHKLLAACLVSAAVGIIKELGDAVDLWPVLCPCSGFSERDLVADAVGIALAAVVLAPGASRRARSPSPPPSPGIEVV